jgi:hypothetical protein
VDDQVPVEMILLALSRLGSASFRSLTAELEGISTPTEVARAFKTALADGFITSQLSSGKASELRYGLTDEGVAALGSFKEVRVADILEVLAAFDDFGGGSLGLVAWEFGRVEEAVSPAWARAIEEGLLEPAGTDPVYGEEVWRLSEDGTPGATVAASPPRRTRAVQRRSTASRQTRTAKSLISPCNARVPRRPARRSSGACWRVPGWGRACPPAPPPSFLAAVRPGRSRSAEARLRLTGVRTALKEWK